MAVEARIAFVVSSHERIPFLGTPSPARPRVVKFQAGTGVSLRREMGCPAMATSVLDCVGGVQVSSTGRLCLMAAVLPVAEMSGSCCVLRPAALRPR